MTFILPCSPTITRQDRFDFLESDDLEASFWIILEYILSDSLESVTDVASLINVLETISVILRGEALTNYTFLQYFLDTHLGDSKSEKSKDFFAVIWPGLVHLALELPSLFPDSCIPPFNGKSTSELILSRRQVASLVVHQFLCSLPAHPWQTESFVDLSPWYADSSSLHRGAVHAYLTALFTYFERLATSNDEGGIIHYQVDDWPIIFTVRVFDEDLEFRLSSSSRLNRMDVITLPQASTAPEYLGLPGGACVVSANKCLGFGPTGTQEEVHVGISPEAYPATLLAPPLRDNQVLVCQGSVLHAETKDTHVDWRSRVMLFMDALELDLVDSSSPAGEYIPDLRPDYLCRELIKAYTAFSTSTRGSSESYSHVATGLWGCGAFGGNRQVKAIIQWCAASMAGVSALRYICSGTDQYDFATELQQFVSGVEDIPEEDRGAEKVFSTLIDRGKGLQGGVSEHVGPDGVFQYVLRHLMP
ncbi:hypothetical protein CDV55_104914 [Aspergillus turcosus]|uniref:poly(ADP-ribose) glycohydrolase n=1 Tax=Aspergillus turcosus TaxID=1245748 RepID=A0A397H765_9EURO|nr:hypothetical protein CDV55_104914 [Aspergillus turcosus]RLL96478.1 hypothetical protein CFD26_103311 [Aspergillus turcosus]